MIPHFVDYPPFLMISDAFFATRVADRQSRVAQNKLTENADICRNMQKSNASKKCRHQNSDREFASCRMQAAAPNADRQMRGAAVLAPLGALRLEVI